MNITYVRRSKLSLKIELIKIFHGVFFKPPLLLVKHLITSEHRADVEIVTDKQLREPGRISKSINYHAEQTDFELAGNNRLVSIFQNKRLTLYHG